MRRKPQCDLRDELPNEASENYNTKLKLKSISYILNELHAKQFRNEEISVFYRLTSLLALSKQTAALKC